MALIRSADPEREAFLVEVVDLKVTQACRENGRSWKPRDQSSHCAQTINGLAGGLSIF